MQGQIEYRGYIIERFGSEYIAKTHEEEDVQLEISAKSASCLIGHIDEMFYYLDNPRARKPGWIKALIKNSRMSQIRPETYIEKQRRRMSMVKAAAAVVLAGFIGANGALAGIGDLDRDGEFRHEDISIAWRFITTGKISRDLKLKIGEKSYNVTLMPTSDPAVNWEVSNFGELPDRQDR